MKSINIYMHASVNTVVKNLVKQFIHLLEPVPFPDPIYRKSPMEAQSLPYPHQQDRS